MIHWEECQPGKTILVGEHGGRSLFLAKHDSFIFYYSLEFSIHYVHHMNEFHGHTIERDHGIGRIPIDLELLRPGHSVLTDGAHEFLYMSRSGDVLSVTAHCNRKEMPFICSVLPEVYAKWSAVKYE